MRRSCLLYAGRLKIFAVDLITCESKVQVVVSLGSVSFVRPREVVSFDPRHVTRSPVIGKRI